MNATQRALTTRFYNHTCFEFMGLEKIRAGDPKGFVEAWESNCNWLQDVVDETRRFITDYENANGDKIDKQREQEKQELQQEREG